MSSRIVKEFFGVMLLAVTFAACQKSAPVGVPPLQDFRDGSNLFSIKFPEGWPQSAQPGKVWVYNTQESANKFFDPTSEGKPGVKIYVYADSAGSRRLDDVVQEFKDELRQEQAQIDQDVQTTLGGNPAVRIPYAMKLDNKNTVYSYRVLAVVDSTVYGYEASGFNDEYKRYTAVFDSVETTYHIIPKAVAQQQQPEDLIPSQTMKAYQNDYFTIQHPDNFVATPKGAAGDIIASVFIKGYRADCTIQVDVLDAKNLNVDKVFDQNKGKYQNVSGTSKVTIDGLAAYQINYSPVRDISSRAYFVVKNNKVIRITLNWNKPMQSDFLPAFEKAVSGLKLK